MNYSFPATTLTTTEFQTATVNGTCTIPWTTPASCFSPAMKSPIWSALNVSVAPFIAKSMAWILSPAILNWWWWADTEATASGSLLQRPLI